MSRYVDVDVPIEQADVSSYVGVEDLRAASAEVELERFLSRPVESEIELSSPAAQRMLEHAATCERCGELLARNIDHAAALMEATQTDGPPDEEAEEIAAAKEADVLLTSKAILATLLPQTVEELSAHVPDDLWNKLPSLRTRSTNAELRAALSVAEASLAIQSVLASNWEGESTARFAELDLVVDEHRIVPGKYFAARIADCIDVALGTAQNVWAGFVSVVAGSRVGLAGLHAEELDGHWKLRLSLDDFGRMRESDERSRAEGSLQQR